jgi:uncharacterized DUF497 family protein
LADRLADLLAVFLGCRCQDNTANFPIPFLPMNGRPGSSPAGILQRSGLMPLQAFTASLCIYLNVFEWDPEKAAANLAKHGVSFDEAATIFADTNALDGPDLRHSAHEARFLRLGRSALGNVVVVAYTFRSSRNGETIRIINARRASRKERAAYRAHD